MYTINVVATDVAGNTAQAQEDSLSIRVTSITIRLSDPSIDDQYGQPACVLVQGSPKRSRRFHDLFSGMGEWSARQTPMRMANEWLPPSGKTIVLEALCCEHCCQKIKRVILMNGRSTFTVVIPVIDVTPPTIKLSEESDSGALGDFTRAIKRRPHSLGTRLPKWVVGRRAQQVIYLIYRK